MGLGRLGLGAGAALFGGGYYFSGTQRLRSRRAPAAGRGLFGVQRLAHLLGLGFAAGRHRHRRGSDQPPFAQRADLHLGAGRAASSRCGSRSPSSRSTAARRRASAQRSTCRRSATRSTARTCSCRNRRSRPRSRNAVAKIAEQIDMGRSPSDAGRRARLHARLRWRWPASPTKFNAAKRSMERQEAEYEQTRAAGAAERRLVANAQLHRHVAGQRRHPAQPGADIRVVAPAGTRPPRRHGCRRRARYRRARRRSPTNQSRAARCSSISASAASPAARLAGIWRALRLGEIGLADEIEPEAQRRDGRLVVVLLPEHPAQHVGAVPAVRPGSARCLRRDTSRRRCFRAGSGSPTCSTGMRPLALTSARNSRRPRLAAHDVVVAPLERQAEQRRGQPDLVAVAAARILVKDQLLHGVLPG